MLSNQDTTMSQEFVKQLFKLSITQISDTGADICLRMECQYIQTERWRLWLNIQPVWFHSILITCDCYCELNVSVENSFLLIRQGDFFLFADYTFVNVF